VLRLITLHLEERTRRYTLRSNERSRRARRKTLDGFIPICNFYIPKSYEDRINLYHRYMDTVPPFCGQVYDKPASPEPFITTEYITDKSAEILLLENARLCR